MIMDYCFHCKCNIIPILRQVCLLDLTADFGVESNTKWRQNVSCERRAKLALKAVCTQ